VTAKKKSRLTLITQWFPPEPVVLWQELALELSAKGYQVTVVTAFPNYPYGKIYEGYKQRVFCTEYVGDVKVIRLPVFPDHSNSIVFRGLSYLSFAFSLLMIGSFRIPKSDLMLCYSPPLTVAAMTALIAMFRRVKFILNIQDMWPDTLIASGSVDKDSKITNFIEFFAKWVYSQTEYIVVLSEGFKNHMEKKYQVGNKTLYIPNLTHQLESTSKGVDTGVKTKLGISDEDFIILYAGNMGPAQQLDVIIDAVGRLSSLSSVKVLLLGDGVSEEGLKKKVETQGVSKIIFAGRVPSSDVATYYNMADALILHLKQNDLFKITIPHKIISYLEAGKPIISAVSGEVNSIVERSKSGLICESGNVEAIAECIEKMETLSSTDRLKLGKNGRSFYKQNFSRNFIAASWDGLIARVK